MRSVAAPSTSCTRSTCWMHSSRSAAALRKASSIVSWSRASKRLWHSSRLAVSLRSADSRFSCSSSSCLRRCRSTSCKTSASESFICVLSTALLSRASISSEFCSHCASSLSRSMISFLNKPSNSSWCSARSFAALANAASTSALILARSSTNAASTVARKPARASAIASQNSRCLALISSPRAVSRSMRSADVASTWWMRLSITSTIAWTRSDT
mmetsp:Transcript_53214/g.142341  ORF Transcript_53214/g.142341 Transcript_53214/m.142341 type:complete len:215 (-) Transcript_53214:1749-2393(-)